MIQYKLIEKLKEITQSDTGIDATILYGSFARGQAGINSDIDIALWLNENFNLNDFLWKLKNSFSNYNLLQVLDVKLRKKIAIYFTDKPKIEVALYTDIDELKRNYLGSKIPRQKINDTIFFDRKKQVKKIITSWYQTDTKDEDLIDNLIAKFIYEFESASNMHNRSDAYQFYYFYNIALHVAVQLKYLSEGYNDYYFLPKKMTVNVIKENEQKGEFYQLSGSIFLRDANEKKRLLLDFFYSTLDKLKYNKRDDIKLLLEKIYRRDYLWNFRDIAKFNKYAEPGIIFRTSSLVPYQKDDFILAFLKVKNIETIIDLRAKSEIEASPYDSDFISNFTYLNMPFDPWNQPDWFKETQHFGTDYEIAYRFFAMACKEQVKEVFNALMKAQGAIAIHCVAGKDRTGFIIMLINMLLETPYEIILNDYLASEMDTDEKKFKIYYDIIQNEGGVLNYLESCGLERKKLIRLKNKLQKK